MTINREAAEQMAARLTSTITSAVDVADTFNEALRLATVALQEPREAPEVEPGTAGTATVRGVEGVRVMRLAESPTNSSRWASATPGPMGNRIWEDISVTDFVPDPDTAALRAQLEDANRALSELAPIIADLDDDTVHDGSMAEILRSGIARLRGEVRTHEALAAVRPSNAQYAAKIREQVTRADAAEARLARLTEGVESVLGGLDRYTTTSDDVLRLRDAFREDLNAVLIDAAADEQAAEGDELRHGAQCGNPSCDC